MDSKTIILGSTSKHKIAALQQVFQEVYPDVQCFIKGVKALSGINEQPVGHTETLQGALHRLSHAKQLIQSESYDFVVAIENGIVPVEIEGVTQWFDVGWVIVENFAGIRAFACSNGVEMGTRYVEEARKRGFDTTTVGAVMAEQCPGLEATDPQLFLTSNLVPRSEMLKQTLKTALGELQRKQSHNDEN